jgi:hypothetical protein
MGAEKQHLGLLVPNFAQHIATGDSPRKKPASRGQDPGVELSLSPALAVENRSPLGRRPLRQQQTHVFRQCLTAGCQLDKEATLTLSLASITLDTEASWVL